MSEPIDYYAALGVPRTATKDEIKAAFRALALKYHPDRNPGDAEAERLFKQAASAYDVLSDDDRRQRYDTTGQAKPLIDVDLASFDDIVQAFFGSMVGQLAGFFMDGLRKMSQPGKEPLTGACKDCDGTGWLPKSPALVSIRKTCSRCRGSGVEPAVQQPVSKEQLDTLKQRVEAEAQKVPPKKRRVRS